MKNKSISIVFAMLVITFGLFICSIVKINQLKQENSLLKDENVELTSCYLCGDEVNICPVNESFYIECKRCELRTAFFDSKGDLINYWNKQ